MALAAARYAEKKGIPFVVDVNDLWPVAMRMVLDIPVVSSVLFYPLQRDAGESVLGLTSGVIGTSDEYRDRPFLHQKREIPRETVYVGNDLADFDDGAEEYMAQVNKAEDEFWVTYAGTIGTSYDVRRWCLQRENWKNAEDPISVSRSLAEGPLKAELEELANMKQIYSVEFVGYAPYGKMAAYLKKSDRSLSIHL